MTYQNKKIVITQSHFNESSFKPLIQIGVKIIYKPFVAINLVNGEKALELDKYIKQASNGEFQWMIFSSANGVNAVKQRIEILGLNPTDFSGIRIAAIGKNTAEAVKKLSLPVDFIPEKENSADFIREFTDAFANLNNAKILFPAGNIARDTIPEKLREIGAEVVRVTAYETIPVKYPEGEILDLFKKQTIDAVVFASSSAVDNLMACVSERNSKFIIPKMRAVSIGPSTSAALRSYGIEPAAEAEKPSAEGIINALILYFNNAEV